MTSPPPRAAPSGNLPLDGITVVSLEQAVAAPYATRQLADLGARVIKVERPDGGDFARNYDSAVKGLASYFVWLNRGKESVALDLKSPAGLAAVQALIGRADVFVQNLAPGAADRMGLSAAALRAGHPGLIVCDVSGYAPDGPMGDQRAYDLLIQCETGLLSVTGSPDAPAKAGISVADIAGGMFAFSSVLAALYTRERTGEGAALSVSLFEALTEWMSQPMYYAMYTGTPPPRTGSDHATIAPYGTFLVAGGGAVQLAVQNDREWRRLCEQVLGQPGLADDPRFATNVARVANRAALRAEIESALAARTPEQVLELLDAAQIANAKMNTVTDLLDHPQLAHRWAEVDSPAGPLRALPSPISLGGAAPALGAIPAVGQHTAAVLAELGLSATEITALTDGAGAR
ncbi:MAG TPA: CaiB/BaiF CoA-transferase family protein [Trebonia sp.]|jgi:itaconate CoA-transferase|nr:CaiB/BaiF CoA-transferase family protein [Trebonia sp.]